MIMSPRRFRTLVLAYHQKHGRRHLPWRKTKDPYKILVSEVMLQQTQVERVIPFYRSFLARFPNVQALADAPLADVLRAWQGLGYNRRAKLLHEAARAVAREHGGRMPKDVATLVTLPGVGPYTAGAIAAFANNEDSLIIETNIRTAVTHHFFPDKEAVSDREVFAVLAQAYPAGQAREWYAALMDYGSFLKRNGVRINAKRTGYAKQKAFAGSMREARGAILKALADGPKSTKTLTGLLGPDRAEQLAQALAALVAEGLVGKAGRGVALAS
jgi:A/G-specific adenine glycosylase